MSKQYPGGIISKTPPTPSGSYETSTASGIWTLDQQAAYAKLGQWPTAGNPAPDAQFNYVSMLLHGDGTNGAQNNTFVDSSSNNFTITRNGNTTQGSFSPYGPNWSNYFPSSSYFSLTNTSAMDFGTGDFTFETWLCLTSYPEAYQIIVDIGGTNPAYLGTVGVTSSTFKVDVSNNVQDALSTSTLNINTWYHIAGVRSSGSVKIYINGVLDSTTAFAGQTGRSTGTTAIGYGLSFGGYAVRGYVSNLRLVKGTAVYTGNFTPSTTPLTAISGTSLLTCQSNRFIDNSTNAYALSVTGTPSVQRFNPFGTSTAYSTSVIGGSGYFDGTTDYLTIAGTSTACALPGDFTIECFYYQLATTNYGNLFSTTTTYSTANSLRVSTGNTTNTFQVASAGAGILNASTTFTPNSWVHVALVRSGTTITLYQNGVSVGSATNSQSFVSDTFIIGDTQGSGAPYCINGYMSNFRVVKGTAVYTTTFTPPTAPLTAITNTQLLLLTTNAGIFDNAMITGLETVGGAQISTSVKKYGTGSMYFDGTGDYLVGNGGQGLGGDFTIEAWVYAVAFTGDARVIVDTRDVWSTSTGLNFYFNDTGNLIMYLNGGDRITSATAYSTATWYFVTLARSGSTITMYVNGTSVGTYTYSTALTDKSITIGTAIDNRSTGTAWHFNGYIDDLRITKGYARYTANFTAPTAAFPDIGPN